MEERVATAGSTAEDNFISLEDNRSDIVSDGLYGVNFDGDGDGLGARCRFSAGSMMKNKICGGKFQSRMRKRKRGEKKKMWKCQCVNQRDFFL